MGHAVYSLSDPRARVFKHFVEALAIEKGRQKDFALYSMIERLAPEVIADKRKIYKGVSANVDFTADSCTVCWIFRWSYILRSCHGKNRRLECTPYRRLVNADKIIRPAYKSIMQERDYVPMDER
mgnify:CR=1 FL=1